MTAGNTLDDLPSAPPSPRAHRAAARWYAGLGILCLLIGGGLGYLASRLLPSGYSAQSQVVVRNPGELTLFGTPVNANPTVDSLSAAQVLKSPEVARLASRMLDGELSADDIGNHIEVSTASNSPVITVTATADTAAQAQRLANVVPQAYLQVDADSYAAQSEQATKLLTQLRDAQQKRLDDVQQQLSQRVNQVIAASAGILDPTDRANWVQATLGSDVAFLQLRSDAQAITTSINSSNDAIQQAQANYAVLETGVDRVIDAQDPAQLSGPSMFEYVALGGVVGLVIGLALGWAVTERRKVLDPAGAAAVLGAPLLGAIPHSRRMRKLPGFAEFSGDSAAGNELKVLASSLVLNARRRGLGAVVVTSAHRREGKSVLARNLAAAGDYIGQPVTLVDTGFGRPTLTEVFDLWDSPGLAEVLEGGPVQQVIHHLPYGDSGRISVIPVGLNGFATEPGRRLNELRRQHWRRVFGGGHLPTALVDAPALNDHPLAFELAGAGGLVVVASPRTSLSDLEVIRNRADLADVPVLGFVLNEHKARRSGRGGSPRHPELGQVSNDVVFGPPSDADQPVPVTH